LTFLRKENLKNFKELNITNIAIVRIFKLYDFRKAVFAQFLNQKALSLTRYDSDVHHYNQPLTDDKIL